MEKNLKKAVELAKEQRTKKLKKLKELGISPGRIKRFELSTPATTTQCSTTELYPPFSFSFYFYFFLFLFILYGVLLILHFPVE